MNTPDKDNHHKKSIRMRLNKKICKITTRFKQLKGNPHHVALGMGFGVFVCATPTFPFQTFLAIALSYVFRANKVAAVIGSWIAAPAIPLFYLGSYKTGALILGDSLCVEFKFKSFTDILNSGLDVAYAMLAGSILVGFIFGVASYFITIKIVKTIRVNNSKVLL